MKNNVLLWCGWTLLINSTSEHNNATTNNEKHTGTVLWACCFTSISSSVIPVVSSSAQKKTQTCSSLLQLRATSLLSLETFPTNVLVLSLFIRVAPCSALWEFVGDVHWGLNKNEKSCRLCHSVSFLYVLNILYEHHSVFLLVLLTLCW